MHLASGVPQGAPVPEAEGQHKSKHLPDMEISFNFPIHLTLPNYDNTGVLPLLLLPRKAVAEVSRIGDL